MIDSRTVMEYLLWLVAIFTLFVGAGMITIWLFIRLVDWSSKHGTVMPLFMFVMVLVGLLVLTNWM